MKPVVVFDLDETLIRTNVLYQSARAAACSIIFQSIRAQPIILHDLTVESIDTIFQSVDLQRRAQLPFSKERFSESLVISYALISAYSGSQYFVSIEKMLRSVGEAIYTQRSEPYEDVFPALKKFSSYAECLIFTTGDVDVQERRLKEAQLLHYFDNVFVTRVKGPVSYGEILKSVTRPELRKIYSIGNSLTMDLLPAKKLMIECLHIVRPEDTGNEIAVPATDMKMLEEVKKINSLEDAFDHIEQECGKQESSVIVAKTPRIIVI